MTIAVTLATIITLLLVTGLKLRSWITIASTLLGTLLSIGITALVIRLTDGAGIKYETMSFLTLPPKEVFLASVLMGLSVQLWMLLSLYLVVCMKYINT